MATKLDQETINLISNYLEKHCTATGLITEKLYNALKKHIPYSFEYFRSLYRDSMKAGHFPKHRLVRRWGTLPEVPAQTEALVYQPVKTKVKKTPKNLKETEALTETKEYLQPLSESLSPEVSSQLFGLLSVANQARITHLECKVSGKEIYLTLVGKFE